jgi:hypothetical protein
MTWAPEASWDHALQKYVVYWSSNLYEESDTNHTAASYTRIMYSTTKDFRKFSPAKVWIDLGENLIDATVAYDASTKTHYRFTSVSADIRHEKSTTGLLGKWTEVTRKIGMVEIGGGEGPLIFQDNLDRSKWHLYVDDYAPRGYQPFETSTPTFLDANNS